ncbi:hypothetical protein SISSUDRAFT_771253 [Sistotremastrum suecicum HHB10207 ss-3]|uniref:Uncharacterized protein n=1 Tax=Sistotremastrum suecicum HHB10207 ss-3 TaxID=1314776 RepID=A0A166D7F2_9AGAM|nr:hypothetical protein SISSUDRAFT_771253 [Sistotremastrum suecicum HHB10207 ss-3]
MLDLPHYHCNHIEDPQVGLPEAPSPQPCKACAEKKGIFPKPKRQDTWNSFTAPRQTRFFRTIINTLSSSALPTQPEAPTPTPTPSPSPAPPSVNVNDNTSTNEQSTGLLSTVFAPFSWVYNAFSRVGYQDPPSNDSASIKPTEPPSDTPTHPAAPENDTATPRTPTRHDTKDSLNPFEQAKISLRRRCGSPERQSRDHEAEERLKADVVCWSACRDGMRTFGSKSGGYMTEAFCNTFNNPDLSFEQAFLEINRRLRAKGIEMQKKYPSTEEVDPGTYKEWGSLQAQLGSYRTLVGV